MLTATSCPKATETGAASARLVRQLPPVAASNTASQEIVAALAALPKSIAAVVVIW